jgi:peptide/nickel transport system ATP-binding protein
MTGGAREVSGPRAGSERLPVLDIDGLSVDFVGRGQVTHAVRSVSITVERGEILALVGESGSGKSVTAMAAMRLLPPTARVSGSIRLGEVDLAASGAPDIRSIRGSRIGMVFQDPMRALNPVFTVGWQVAETIRLHQPELSRAERTASVLDVLERAGIPEPRRRLEQYPHELSGGLRQRVMIAMAVANEPELVIADEATTALDVTVQAEILELFRELRERTGMALVVITHNMGVVADVADRVVVMRAGEVVEQAPVEALFAQPEHAYTRELLSAVPRLSRPGATPAEPVRAEGREPVLEIRDLAVEFGPRGRRFRAIDGVSLQIAAGQVVGLVGESGSGKSTVGRAAVGLYPPAAGSISVLGQDLARLARRELQRLRRSCALVLQDPASSLDPRMTLRQSIAEPMAINGVGRRSSRERRVAEVLDMVRLGAGFAGRYPHELSGGQLQRASIARALVLEPRLLVADEPTSALDVSVQASVLEVFLDLQREIGFACLFITHDLAVVSMLANEVIIMSQGRVVETGAPGSVLFEPREEYTRRLVGAAPVPDPVEQRRRRRERIASLRP